MREYKGRVPSLLFITPLRGLGLPEGPNWDPLGGLTKGPVPSLLFITPLRGSGLPEGPNLSLFGSDQHASCPLAIS
jgi:hypothetical protein